MARCGSKNWHQKDKYQKRLDYMFRICYHFRLNSQHDWGGYIWQLNEHYDNENDIHMSSRNDDANVYRHNLDLLPSLHLLHVSYHMRSGWREKSIHLRHVYLSDIYWSVQPLLHEDWKDFPLTPFESVMQFRTMRGKRHNSVKDPSVPGAPTSSGRNEYMDRQFAATTALQKVRIGL